MNDHRSAPAEPCVVIIDDSPDDIFFARRALLAAGLQYPIVDFSSVVPAFEFLRSGANVAAVFCDVRLPEASGFDFLTWTRADPKLRRLKVVMLSTSDLPDDIRRAELLGADSYLVKFPPPSAFARVLNGHAQPAPFPNPYSPNG